MADEQQAKKDQEVKPVSNKTRPSYGHPGFIIGIFAAIVLVFILGMSVTHFADRRKVFIDRGAFGGEMGRRIGGHMEMFGEGQSFSDQNRLSGVVTNVSGNNFTIAGHGTTSTVTTNSSTQYTNGSSVKVNDSVVVFGTISNNTFTATQIVINP